MILYKTFQWYGVWFYQIKAWEYVFRKNLHFEIMLALLKVLLFFFSLDKNQVDIQINSVILEKRSKWKTVIFKMEKKNAKEHVWKRWLKVIQLEKACFIKVNELKWTEVELFWVLHFMCAAANAFELFCMPYLANNERFLYHSSLSF